MAQTIAIQRGSVACSWNNTSTTIFTQSGGTATRVIWGGVEVTQNTAGSGAVSCFWILSSGSTSTPIPIAIKAVGNNSSGSLAMFPDGSSGKGLHSGWQASTGAMISAQAVLKGTSAGTTFANGAGGWTVAGGTNNGEQNISSQWWEQYPQNFWMGPSDSLVWKGSNGNNTAGTIYYTFVTVTES